MLSERDVNGFFLYTDLDGESEGESGSTVIIEAIELLWPTTYA